MKEFNHLVGKARTQAKAAGSRRSGVTSTIAEVYGK